MKLCAHCIYWERQFSSDPVKDAFEFINENNLQRHNRYKNYCKRNSIMDEGIIPTSMQG
jgi:hypothetical protein